MILEYAAPLLSEAATSWPGRAPVSPEETAAGRAAAEILGLEPLAVLAVTPYTGARDHTLHVFSQDRAHAGALPAAAGHGHETPARHLKSDPFMFGGPVVSRETRRAR